jgi:hypothetical protein
MTSDGNTLGDNYGDKVAGGGRKISVKFADGEPLRVTLCIDVSAAYLSPADLQANNERIFVVKSAAEKIEVA